MDQCPVPTMYAEINIANHLAAIQYANLGPADPREPSTTYWLAKQELWNVPEGVARTRLCMNCEYYDKSEDSLVCISSGPQLQASELPVTPRWADVDGMPSAVCTRWNITCSALRTCDDWDAGDPEEDEYEDDMSAAVYYDETEKAARTYKPTSGMATAARRALEWRKEGKRGGTRVGLARAGQLVRGENLTESTVMRMHSFFSRHEVDKQATGFSSGEDGYPSPGRVAWDLWGGDAGQTWSKAKRDQIVRAREQD